MRKRSLPQPEERTERRISAATSLSICALTVIAQIVLTLALTQLLAEKISYVYFILELAGAVVAIWVYLRPGSPSYKLVWMCLLLALPVVAVAAALSPAGVVADSHTMEPTGEAMEVWERLPDDLSMERRMVVTYALALVDKVDYFWGGKSLVLGWDDRWGELTEVTAEGSETTGTEQPYGLDCSGFVDWAFYNASGGEYVIGQGGGAMEQHANCVDIEWDAVQPGDLLFYPEDEHVGIAAGRDWLGRLLVVHCASGTGGVAISHRTGFETAARPVWYGDE